MAYDNICRYLTTEYASTFASWLLNIDTSSIALLPTELKLDPITQLDDLSEALLDFSSEADLVSWLQSHQ
ncbi:DUF4351 domain-containing protein [Gloeocapsopsis dulcis]|uniref:DUF4351 domain-containing protein n=1 Tax=Gloeocapsopsis dulcis AAB1 = 1H9 TaxID=1433147 RepID=A0A6N8FQR2_9CHRO|nr:DUF4351 domain-containing protein [Gloeocapsopsis dulcis]MUL35279.1 hypothetical protein [Gloeocapsopsis dulcis AAB1 = 1H9]WNN89160.1 DUF4351 domain-containing protein [Gloeocapsopsis dulcis]